MSAKENTLHHATTEFTVQFDQRDLVNHSHFFWSFQKQLSFLRITERQQHNLHACKAAVATVPPKQICLLMRVCEGVQAKEEGKDAAEPVAPVMRTVSKSSEDWKVQNDSKPLWTRSPREVSHTSTDNPVLSNSLGGIGLEYLHIGEQQESADALPQRGCPASTYQQAEVLVVAVHALWPAGLGLSFICQPDPQRAHLQLFPRL